MTHVDAYSRPAQDAAFDGRDVIRALHESVLTSNGKLMVPAFSNETTPEVRVDTWAAARTRHVAPYMSWPAGLPCSTGDTP